jgi:trigger factor
MQTSLERVEPTKFKLTISAEVNEILAAKDSSLLKLSANVRVPGFRSGKAPAALVEKQIDPSSLQSEFLEQIVNQLYTQAVNQQKLRPVASPEITITKFVPFTNVEFTAETESVGVIKISDYKKIRVPKKKVSVSTVEVNQVLENLRQRGATKSEVKRAAKDGDEAVINFSGNDTKTKEPIEGAAGQDYPLVLGSKNFIPGFEGNIIGLKSGDTKEFDLVFPKDYSAAELQGRKVTFEVSVIKVQQLKLPKLDDAFAASLGPFKTVADLKADAKKELTAEKEQQNQRAYENEVLEKIAADSDVPIPQLLIEEESKRMEEDEKRDLAYRGQTWQEHLDAEGISAEQHRKRNEAGASARVKAGLILGEVADQEKITVSPEDLQIRIQLLKGQYTDVAMQSELDKPENQRDILSRMMTEKTLDLLCSLASKA